MTWVDEAGSSFAPTAAMRELVESKRLLEQKIEQPVPYLAWPVGWYNDRQIEMAKQAGYQALLTAEEGANGPGDDVFRIKRLFVDGACDLPAFARLIETQRYEPCTKGGERAKPGGWKSQEEDISLNNHRKLVWNPPFLPFT